MTANALADRRARVRNFAIADDLHAGFSALLGVVYETENQEAIILPLIPCDL